MPQKYMKILNYVLVVVQLFKSGENEVILRHQ
jgi:DNA-binding protein